MPPPARFAALLLAALLLAAVAAGCARTQTLAPDAPEYPAAAAQARVLDIQVTRDQTHITFTNTTASSIPPCRMWVNRWWSLELAGIAVGQTLTLDLRDFKDVYGEPFRGGGFFATEAPDRLILAQFQIRDELVGLIVINQ